MHVGQVLQLQLQSTFLLRFLTLCMYDICHYVKVGFRIEWGGRLGNFETQHFILLVQSPFFLFSFLGFSFFFFPPSSYLSLRENVPKE